MIRLMIVDDHELIRLGIRGMVENEEGITVTDEAKSGDELLEKLETQDYDVILLDISMPGRSGIEILKQMKELGYKIPVLILSIHLEKNYALRALRAGAAGFLNKKVDSEEIVRAIRKIHSGKRYITDIVADKLADELSVDPEVLSHERLSDREYEIMLLLAKGYSLMQIGEKFNISPKTVTTYRKRVMEKMNFENNADMTRYALEFALLDE